ncbi:hypothetical protein MNBD_ALPHA12-1836 [hydrothermal vent metagenome]|uniref:SCP domain-containing protein n=1 Tax=hydrothermal vent metagenome TaxID=652676 RepID=A0A3B0UP02_9ZZZZ
MANQFFRLLLKRTSLVLSFFIAAVIISACSTGALAPGLVARMDKPGAILDRAEALNIINQYRATRGAPLLSQDANLNSSAEALAKRYSINGTPPAKPGGGIVQIRFSAGYANFAETFSGWRNRQSDADAIADPRAVRAGLAVVYSANSAYGTHWVLLLGGPTGSSEAK